MRAILARMSPEAVLGDADGAAASATDRRMARASSME
jgi:hypothetical protein